MARRRRRRRGGGDAGPPPVSRRYELRWPSFVYIATALFLAVGAVNSQNNLLYWAFGAAVSGVVLSGLISGAALMGLRVRREAVASPRAGQGFALRYRVSNVNRFIPLFALVVEEVGAGPGEGAGVEVSPAAVAHCAAGGQAAAEASGLAVRRGEVRLGRVRVTSTFPFGLVRKALVFDLPAEVLVLPAVVAVRPDLGRGASQSRRDGGDPTRRSGAGEEFYALREYTPGDPLSSIAWKRSAALGSLVVRQTSSPAPPRVWVEIHDSAFAAGDDDFETAVVAAASLLVDMDRRGRAVGLSAPAAGLALPPGHGPRSVARSLQALARLDHRGGAGPAARRPGGKDGLLRVGVGPTGGGVDARDTASWIGAGASLPAPPRLAVRRRAWRRAGARA